MNVGVHRSGIFGGERDTVVMRGVDVVEDIQHGLHMTQRRLIPVGGEERVGCRDVRACSRRQPTDTANETLISILRLDLRKRVISIDRQRDGINRNSGSIRGGHRSCIEGLADEALDKICGKTRLVKMDVN
jgi:hypothetical protein